MSDYDKLQARADQLDREGRPIEAGMLRVAAHNSTRPHVRVHQPNIGPYTQDNPRRCMNCTRPFKCGEECP